jgi:hypothetical protein
MLQEIVPQAKGRIAVGETYFLMEGAAGEQTADEDDLDMVVIFCFVVR